MPNRLAAAASPYLLQHQDNPVDWYEWGDDAFAAARRREVPILLSIGYSACHWCHVMAHESFEDPGTAAYMNEHFVNVKVDREERPDVDRVYMDATTAMSGHGGWPMTVFLTPDGLPLYAGTYYPKQRMHGRPSFMDVMAAVNDAWVNRRSDVLSQAGRLAAAVQPRIRPSEDLPDRAGLERALEQLDADFDTEWGGFGGAPKFPQAPTLEFLMRIAALAPRGRAVDAAVTMLDRTLDEMARGGIYDQIGGGFARYSVDRRWLVPHFEKMLYDNALLARVYLRSWQLTGRENHRRIATETLDYLLRDLADDAGGFHAAEDADSEGVEGKFYVWSWDELGEVLGADRDLAATVYGASPAGNFEGNNILFLPSWPDVDDKTGLDERLFDRRRTRVRPGLDDKVVTAWNGLAMRAFAEAGAVLGSRRYLDAATAIGAFLADQVRAHGGLLRSWRRGRSGPGGFCDDYAAAAVGFFTLYQASGDAGWYEVAARLTTEMIERFADDAGGFFSTAHDAERLIARPKSLQDNPTPSDNALAAEALSMLAAYTGDSDLHDRVEQTVRSAGLVLERHPAFAGHMLAVWSTALFGAKEVAVVEAPHLTEVVWEAFRPDVTLATTGNIPLLRDREAGHAYVCRNMVCDLPVDSADDLRTLLDASS